MKNKLARKLRTLAANCRAVQIEALQARPAALPSLLRRLDYARHELDEAADMAKNHHSFGTRPQGVTSGVAISKARKEKK